MLCHHHQRGASALFYLFAAVSVFAAYYTTHNRRSSIESTPLSALQDAADVELKARFKLGMGDDCVVSDLVLNVSTVVQPNDALLCAIISFLFVFVIVFACTDARSLARSRDQRG